ncbi:MAG: hypothetical protein QOE61_338 [Micromonosporaceae bacterium]|jgi:hypothetical protein|nr:hypothetical protein [Micromonosporaceae bacterium]
MIAPIMQAPCAFSNVRTIDHPAETRGGRRAGPKVSGHQRPPLLRGGHPKSEMFAGGIRGGLAILVDGRHIVPAQVRASAAAPGHHRRAGEALGETARSWELRNERREQTRVDAGTR